MCVYNTFIDHKHKINIIIRQRMPQKINSCNTQGVYCLPTKGVVELDD